MWEQDFFSAWYVSFHLFSNTNILRVVLFEQCAKIAFGYMLLEQSHTLAKRYGIDKRGEDFRNERLMPWVIMSTISLFTLLWILFVTDWHIFKPRRFRDQRNFSRKMRKYLGKESDRDRQGDGDKHRGND